MTIDLDIIFGLCDIDSVEHVEQALLFDGHGRHIVKEVHQDVRRMLAGRCYGKVNDLTHENDVFNVDQAQVEAGFVGSRCETKFTKYAIGVFFPEAWGFGVALHRG
jgi:hypothetical protein